MKNIFIFIFFYTIIFVSCNKKYDEPEFYLSPPEYTIDASTSAGARVLDFYRRTSTFILYKELNYRDFGWNFNVINILNPNIVEIKEEELDKVLDFLEDNLFSYYSDQYMRDFFPYRIPIADTISSGKTIYNFTETEASILLSNLSLEFVELPVAKQKTYISGMHNVFLNMAAKKIERKISDDYFKLSDYNFTAPSTATTTPKPKELGFWTMPVKSGQVVSPTRINDLIEWIKTIAKYSEDEIQEQFYYTKSTPDGNVLVYSEAMSEKYKFLTSFLKDNYNTDLHTLSLLFK